MEEEEKNTLQSIFEVIEDPRVERTKQHQLIDIIIIAILGVLCGADGWVDIESFGNTKETWLKTFLDLPNGIPSHDTFGRVFARIDPKQFETCFLTWVESINEKSNEITAIPEILKLLVLEGCIVTIDAMGTQRTIAAQIIEQKGDYALALKDNQGTLYEDVKDTFALAQKEKFRETAHQFWETTEKNHGRLEIRKHWLIDDEICLNYLNPEGKWKGLRAIGMVESQRR